MDPVRHLRFSVAALVLVIALGTLGYALIEDWRAFEHPPSLEGVPDYTEATFKKRQPEFERLRARLRVIDPTRMFSSTVRCLNTRRPSGTMTAPNLTTWVPRKRLFVR